MLARWCKRLLEFSFTELPEWSWITVRCAVADWTGPADAYVTGSWSALDCEVAEPVLELVSLCNTSTAITRLDCKHQALLSAPLSAVLKFISAAAEWYLSGQKSGCLRELCSALLDLRGQASSLFLARLWVLEEMGLWRGGGEVCLGRRIFLRTRPDWTRVHPGGRAGSRGRCVCNPDQMAANQSVLTQPSLR